MIHKIKYWWQGKYISAEERDGGMGILMIGIYERHWTSELIHSLLKFLGSNWKILLPVFVGSAVALFVHFDTKTTGKTEQEKQHEINRTINIHKSPIK